MSSRKSLLALCVCALALSPEMHSQVLSLEHAAVANGGAPAANSMSFHTNSSHGRALSRNGRWFVFRSNATNLAPGVDGQFSQVYILDRMTRTTELVSVNGATPGNGYSLNPAVSNDGRYVVFHSDASNLVDNDQNGVADVFVRDRLARVTYRASVGPEGQEGSESSAYPAISGDGQVVAFASASPEFAPEVTGESLQMYVRMQSAGLTELVSRTPEGVPGLGTNREVALSSDGRFVAFESQATDLMPYQTSFSGEIFVLDRQTGTMEHVSVRADGTPSGTPSISPSISDDGRHVGFHAYGALDPADSNGSLDGYVRDRIAGTTQRVTLAHNMAELPLGAFYMVLSGDGKWVVFLSSQAGVLPGVPAGTSHVYLRRLSDGQMRLVTVNSNGDLPNDNNLFPALGGDGSTVGFASYATNWFPDVGAPTIQQSVYLASPDIDEIHAADFN